ncbi:glycoside hydrolase superfamily [Aspergillus spectabilis]
MSGTGIKRILSFGRWAFSVERPTYTIFREGVTAANRLAFANNVVAFINEHELEGVDFDWEYPAAPDLPDIPPEIIEEGRIILTPASYCYLKGYPIKEISKIVDYIIYMTYDLHRQWDYGNKYSSEGCPEGNCLRSHVNITDTHTALAMITKAGVPARKVFCGIASYGRSFKMAEEGCTGPRCHFTGSNTVSDAAKGVCTDEGGYIAAAEIREIIGLRQDTDMMTETWHDGASNSDILVYDGLEWVA